MEAERHQRGRPRAQPQGSKSEGEHQGAIQASSLLRAEVANSRYQPRDSDCLQLIGIDDRLMLEAVRGADRNLDRDAAYAGRDQCNSRTSTPLVTSVA